MGELKGFVTAETNVPAARQLFYLNGYPLTDDSRTLQECGIHDGEMIALLVQPNNMPSQRGQRGQGGQSSRPGQQSSQDMIESNRRNFLADPRTLAHVRQQAPQLADAINDPVRFREQWEDMDREAREREQERHNQTRLLNEDPFNIDAQRRIEELIRQDRVMENLEHAYEYSPEGMWTSLNNTASMLTSYISLWPRHHAVH